jgi:sodium-dependent dicarboxylate transporter 2/3/5
MNLPTQGQKRSWITLALGPALAAGMLIVSPGDEPAVGRMAAIAIWMAAWWITEAVPVAITALLPLVAVPFAGIAPVGDVAENYSRSTIYLFLGGFLIALGLQHSGLHRRVALGIVHRVGSNPRRLVLGFMLATWSLSMWISNTSTTLLMLPIVLSVLATAREQGGDEKDLSQIAIAILLGVAYSANMGGMATLVGTPPNLAFARLFVQLFPAAPEVTFFEWMSFALPFSMVFLVLGWLLLTRVCLRLPTGELLGGRKVVSDLRDALGPLRRDEALCGAVFGITALLWMTGSGVRFGDTVIPGWRELLGVVGMVDDAVVAVAMAMLLFVLPSHDRPGKALLEWSMTSEVPWGILLLFGGGFALADGFTTSGLSAWAGSQFEVLEGTSPWLIIALVAASLTFLTELTSNIATTEMLLPILAAAAVTLGIDPRALMITATLSASCAFMMPVATPPTAIIYASGLVPIRSMVRCGLWFNILGIALVLAVVKLLAEPLLGLRVGELPDWAGN